MVSEEDLLEGSSETSVDSGKDRAVLDGNDQHVQVSGGAQSSGGRKHSVFSTDQPNVDLGKKLVRSTQSETNIRRVSLTVNTGVTEAVERKVKASLHGRKSVTAGDLGSECTLNTDRRASVVSGTFNKVVEVVRINEPMEAIIEADETEYGDSEESGSVNQTEHVLSELE